MRPPYLKYLIGPFCFMAAIACSLIPALPDKPPKTLATDTRPSIPIGSTPKTPKPTPQTYIPSVDPCDIVTSEPFKEIDDLHLLPDKVQAIFDFPIANKGEPFNATDVVDLSKPEIPGARFVVAGISPAYALIAVERGGVAHSEDASLYYSASGDLQLVRSWSVRPSPAYPTDLRGLKIGICK